MNAPRYTNAIGLLLVLLVLVLWSYTACAQTALDAPVSIEANPSTTRQLLRYSIEQGFRLAYSESYMDLNKSINLRKASSTVREVLDAIGRATGTTYQVRGNQIIFRKKTPSSPLAATSGRHPGAKT